MDNTSSAKPSLVFVIFRALIGSLFIALSAQIAFDLSIGNGIPITAQSFAVLVLAYAYKNNTAILAVVFYLLLGGFGLPFFAGGTSGFEVLSGNSGGYLYGFLPAAFAMKYFSTKNWDRSFPKSLAAMTIGTAIILLFGIIHLSINGVEEVLKNGFYPFLGGAAIKIVVGAAVWPFYHAVDNYYKKKNG